MLKIKRLISRFQNNSSLKEGEMLLEGGDYSQAIISFQHALAENPKSIDAYIGISKALMKKGGIANSKKAIECLRKGLKADPNSSDVYLNIAEIYDKLGKKKDAATERKKAFTVRALKNDPDNVTTNNNMGVLLLKQNSCDEAIKYFRKSVTIDSKYQLGYTNLSKAWYQKANSTKDSNKKKAMLKQSLSSLEKALALGENAACMLMKAKVLTLTEQYEEALACCDKAYALDPAMKEIYATKKLIHEKNANIDEANLAYDGYKKLEKVEAEEKANSKKK